MEQYPVTEEQVRFFQENGYIRLDDVLGKQEGEEFDGPLFPVVSGE